MEDVRVGDPDTPAGPADLSDHQRDTLLVIGEGGPQVKVERTLGDLYQFAEEPVDGLPPAVLTRYLIPPGSVPQQVLGEQVVESGEIALGEGGVPVPDASDVRMLGP